MTAKVLAQAYGQNWALYNGDSALVLNGLPTASVGLVVTSLPFSNVYSYTPSVHDLGNTVNALQFFRQFKFMTTEMKRVLMPGRIFAIHCKNLPLYSTRDGVSGRWDFRGMIIRHMVKQGYIYHSEVTIDKDPRIPAKAYHAQNLLYVTLNRDSSKSGSCEADYICFFRTPGENPIPIKNDITHPEWVTMAHPVWTDISEVDVIPPAKNMVSLNGMMSDDARHLCPLQKLPVSRCIRLYSNPGEVVCDLFNGIGTVGVVSMELGRRYVGVELNEGYFNAAVKNIQEAEALQEQGDLFSTHGIEVESRFDNLQAAI